MSGSQLSHFLHLVDQSVTDPDALTELNARYQTEAAFLVVDLTGMVHRSDRIGIIATLAVVRAAMRAIQPAIEAHGGTVTKTVADTMFIVFPKPRAALFAAFDVQGKMADFNRQRPADPIWPSAGLGFGSCYLIPGEDVYGAEVNRAFVLGEDVAGANQILATPTFRTSLGEVPQGVGLHDGNQDLAHQVGFHFVEFRDYRD